MTSKEIEEEEKTAEDIDDQSSTQSGESFEEYISYSRESFRRVSDCLVVADELSISTFDEGAIEEPEWSAQTNFFADSPYYNAFVEKEMHSFDLVNSITNDLSSKIADMTKTATLMNKALQRLSVACQLQAVGDNSKKGMDDKRNALGPEVCDVLEHLAKVLVEIASAQEQMCNTVKESLGSDWKKGAGEQTKAATNLNSEARSQTEKAETIFFRYLHGKESVNELELSRSTSSSLSDLGNWLSAPNKEETPVSPPRKGVFGWTRIKTEEKPEPKEQYDYEEPNWKNAVKLSNTKLTLQKVRVEQATAELKRLQLSKFLVESRCNRTVGLRNNTSKFLHGMDDYFQRCVDKISALRPWICQVDKKNARDIVEHRKNVQPVWQQRENLLVQCISNMRKETKFAREELRKIRNSDPASIEASPWDECDIERQVQVWDLPEDLAGRSRYIRMKPPGVLFEGWLYQKSSSLISLQTWNREWFILKEDAIYNLQSVKNTTKIKICDVVLCTVREVPDAPNNRFRFELIVPKQKPIMLQARGPKDYGLWVNGIRAAIAGQLTVGDPNSLKLNRDIGKNKQSSEIRFTVWERKNAMFDSIGKQTASKGFAVDAIQEEHDHESLLVQKLMEDNPICAECGEESPDWVSLNLGILVCLECSGVHRSLGVHVSKVRSLSLDELGDGEAALLTALGNDRANDIWESALTAEQRRSQRPTSSSDRSIREDWIKRKYVTKEFVNSNEHNGKTKSEEELSKELFEAVKLGDLIGAARCLACGANTEWINDDQGGQTAMQLATSRLSNESNHALECAELLIQNGAKLD